MKTNLWTPQEETILQEYLQQVPMQMIYKALPQRSKTAIDQKILRMRLEIVKTVHLERVSENLIIKILTQRIGDPKNFQPNRDFYNRTNIGQKRFWQLYRGEKNPTLRELKAICQVWNTDIKTLLTTNQEELPL